MVPSQRLMSEIETLQQQRPGMPSLASVSMLVPLTLHLWPATSMLTQPNAVLAAARCCHRRSRAAPGAPSPGRAPGKASAALRGLTPTAMRCSGYLDSPSATCNARVQPCRVSTYTRVLQVCHWRGWDDIRNEQDAEGGPEVGSGHSAHTRGAGRQRREVVSSLLHILTC